MYTNKVFLKDEKSTGDYVERGEASCPADGMGASTTIMGNSTEALPYTSYSGAAAEGLEINRHKGI